MKILNEFVDKMTYTKIAEHKKSEVKKQERITNKFLKTHHQYFLFNFTEMDSQEDKLMKLMVP